MGKSIIGVWVAAPQFSNQSGQISLEGVIPGGLKTSNGLLTTLTFRVKSVGQAVVKFSDQSKILRNDGVGTDILDRIQNGIYQLSLPPPAGPLVVSETHPDQTKWHASGNLVLSWASPEEAQGYSYVLNQEPIDIPDDISEGTRPGVSYRELASGRHYFHIKALRDGVWGETTHFAVLVDVTPPAVFPIEILPAARTASRQPVFQFSSTDADSGLDHYELKLISLRPEDRSGEQSLFIETASPHVPVPLELGDYDVIIRAYDVAGNYQESLRRLSIVNPLFRLFSDRGLVIRDLVAIPWIGLWVLLGLLILALAYLAFRFRLTHFHLHRARGESRLPPGVSEQLSELQKYRERYGKSLLILLCTGSLFASLWSGVSAQVDPGQLAPPVVTSFSRHISNQDIFYIGGKSGVPSGEVVIFVQNPATGELWSRRVETDYDGEWFYRHDALLPAGSYLLWTQARQGNEASPPGPQLGLAVESQALQFGASRLSYQAVYLVIIFILSLVLIALIIDVFIHARRIRHKRARLQEEVREAEESVRRGFAVLRRDIERELHAHRQTKQDKELEEKLLADLAKVEKYIGKEIWDIEQVEYNSDHKE